MGHQNVLDLFSIKEAVSLSGLRRPMLDYLCRTGIVVPSQPGQRGRGRRRLYSFGDVLLLKALARLLRAGVSAKRLKESFRNLGRRCSQIGPLTKISSYLVTDGERVYLRESAETLEDLSAGGQLSFAFVLELSLLHRQLREEAERLRSA
jgi:DNA-binding transcriptional MerR regulator